MSSSENLRVGWIGLGSMGLAMATNLQKHIREKDLPSLIYWNRTTSRGSPLKEDGGVPSESIEDLAQNCDVIFISVSEDEALNQIVNKVIESGTITNKIFVDTTTVHPSTTASITTQLQIARASYIAAPTISPFLKGVLARAVVEVGPKPSKAPLLKTTSNFITAGLMYLLSEAYTLAAKTDLPAAVLESLVEQNFGAYAHSVSKRLTSGAYFPAEGQAPTSGFELGIKDVGHGVNLAKDVGMKLEIGELYLAAAEKAKTHGDETGRRCDSSSVFGVVRQRAGLDFETNVLKGRNGKKWEEMGRNGKKWEEMGRKKDEGGDSDDGVYVSVRETMTPYG